MKNSFFSRFTPKEPKFFPLLKQLSELLCEASVVLIESLQHDSPTERSDYYKKIKDLNCRMSPRRLSSHIKPQLPMEGQSSGTFAEL